MRNRFALLLLQSVLLVSAISSCGGGTATTDSQVPAPVDGGSSGPDVPAGLDFIKTVAITSGAEGGSARPEIVVTEGRAYVVYLGHIAAGINRTFNVKIFDSGLGTLIASKTIVAPGTQYGSPTDIRIAADGQFLYAFYETATITETFLHGAKYVLNDSFDLAAAAPQPVATGRPVFELGEGEEVLNDPAPLVGPDGVFVVTRLWSGIATAGSTIYRVREFSKETMAQKRQFDLDLSGVADGRGRVTSLLYFGGSIHMALATTVSDAGANDSNRMSDDGAQCDILLVRMKPDWTFDPSADVLVISAEPDDRENYITGLRTDGRYFYLTYKQAVGSPPTGEQRSVIKIFDMAFNLLLKQVVRSVAWGAGGGEIRPSLEVRGNMVYSGQSTGSGIGTGNAEIVVYELR